MGGQGEKTYRKVFVFSILIVIIVRNNEEIRNISKSKIPPVKTDIRGKKPWLKCRKCGEKWYPTVRKSRNKKPDVDEFLCCPHCDAKNRVPRVLVNFLLEKAYTETEFGFD